ncbi:hypothetical protein GUJ93_ZPchr0003g16770 [Zizania palustris]|uniref:Uncharacterized protein n=1 Tax=Zizania palustris TaxID=103762 RepID=A0A8J5RVM8_ZIZPA|nr:hypothetical protein GUJ93_ZPchr0003g16770 [Zizania palustris]
MPSVAKAWRFACAEDTAGLRAACFAGGEDAAGARAGSAKVAKAAHFTGTEGSVGLRPAAPYLGLICLFCERKKKNEEHD